MDCDGLGPMTLESFDVSSCNVDGSKIWSNDRTNSKMAALRRVGTDLQSQSYVSHYGRPVGLGHVTNK